VFCARCGEQIPDASETCPLCGREASLQIDPPAPLPAVSHPQSAALTLPAITGLSGVGGWLLVFCIMLTVLAPLAVLFPVVALRRIPSNYFMPELVRVLYGVIVGIVLWSRQAIALMMLRIYFVVLVVTLGLAWLRLIAASLQSHTPVFLLPVFAPVLTYTGGSILWFVYFRKSVRVKNTYGSNV
jgi:hypothetical protein